MLLTLDPSLRGAAALIAVGVYLVPPAVGVLAEIGHAAYHLHEAIEVQKEKAAAFGLAPLRQGAHVSSLEAEGRHEFVHTHDGVTHHHSAGVDALLGASGHLDQEVGTASSMPMELSAHLPSPGTRALPVDASTASVWRWHPSPDSRPGPRPPLPPPRV